METNLQGPIFILGAHKSGTTLLRNVLDGHPQLSVIPFESHIFEVLGIWLENPYRISLRIKRKDRNEFIDSAIENIKHYNSLNNPYADAILKDLVDEDKFKKSLNCSGPMDTDKDRILAYFNAIVYALDMDLSKIFVEKSVENYEYACYLKKIFPNAKFVHVLRNPYANVVSLRKYRQKSRNNYPRLDRVVETIKLSYYYAYKNSMLLDDYKVIKYEKLVSNPDIVVKEMADYLGIKFDDILLTPTSQSHAWKGNSTAEKAYESISRESVDKWIKDIYCIEAKAINRYLSFALEAYGYKKETINCGIWWPLRRESWRSYLNNRLYLFS